MLNKKLFSVTVCSAIILFGYSYNLLAQTVWTKYAGNPVLQKGTYPEWDMFAAADPCVIRDGDTLKIWYTGAGTTLSDTTIRVRIGYAYSLDGINWTKYPENPVLIPTPGDWDSLGLETVTVLEDTTAPDYERYRMWYAGSADPVCGLYQIGYAYSPDGIHWTKHPDNPVLSCGPDSSWENAGPEGPTVIIDGDTLKMWYAGLDTIPDGQPTDYHLNIGYAWSLDGVNWTKYPDNPVLSVGAFGSWEFAYIQDPLVIKIDNEYHMWYAGTGDYDVMAHQIGYACSSDGINWVKSSSNPVLQRGSTGSWDGNTASFPSVIWDDSLLCMWYTGLDTFPMPPWPEPFYWDIGYATAVLTGIEEVEIPDFNVESLEIYPNPFTQNTEIRFRISDISSQNHVIQRTAFNISLHIYDLSGRLVKSFPAIQSSDNTVTGVVWDGTDESGNKVASGIYLCQLKVADEFSLTRRLLYLR